MTKIDRRTEELTDALRRAGVRITRQRAALLSVIAAADDHPEAVELQRRAEADVPGISLSTVYRTLTELEAQGVIMRHQFEGTPARFEHTETDHHDHMIDVDSGDVIEFSNDRIERLQAEIAEAMGYEIVHHRLELYVRKKRRASATRRDAE
ncbi:Fur family transcriptional regulator [Pseudooceanicola sp.]|uniref:Fur family transcriptional regulator n=1 Tax=Pseudooceanicola sp. TaxID=1914328 RepID=UPI0035C715D7